jgi:hypothetical protein
MMMIMPMMPAGHRDKAIIRFQVPPLNAEDAEDAVERGGREKPHRQGRETAKEQKSFTAEDAKDAEGLKSHFRHSTFDIRLAR